LKASGWNLNFTLSARRRFPELFESRARKNGALKSDPLWRRSGAISPFQVEKILRALQNV
jgi:hypothetical protein